MKWYKFDVLRHWDEIYGMADAEDLAYRRLQDLYYQNEGPLPVDKLEQEVNLDWECIEPVLLKFFVHKDGTHWLHERWQSDIENRKRKAKLNALAGKIGGKKKKLRSREHPQ